MKTTVEKLSFPCEIKDKIKMKVSTGNLNIDFISGHLIKIDKTNLSLEEPHKIIVKNKNYVLLALLYNNNQDKIYLPNYNLEISFTKYVSILNFMNKNSDN